jgi:uncharacterized membrane protein YdjX (TVP38/TMEM64 family)
MSSKNKLIIKYLLITLGSQCPSIVILVRTFRSKEMDFFYSVLMFSVLYVIVMIFAFRRETKNIMNEKV